MSDETDETKVTLTEAMGRRCRRRRESCGRDWRRVDGGHNVFHGRLDDRHGWYQRPQWRQRHRGYRFNQDRTERRRHHRRRHFGRETVGQRRPDEQRRFWHERLWILGVVRHWILRVRGQDVFRVDGRWVVRIVDRRGRGYRWRWGCHGQHRYHGWCECYRHRRGLGRRRAHRGSRPRRRSDVWRSYGNASDLLQAYGFSYIFILEIFWALLVCGAWCYCIVRNSDWTS